MNLDKFGVDLDVLKHYHNKSKEEIENEIEGNDWIKDEPHVSLDGNK